MKDEITSKSHTWPGVVSGKIKILHQQIAALQNWVSAAGGSREMLDALCVPYYKALESIYAEDVPLAEAIENSDLLIHVKGAEADAESPRLSIIADIFNRVRKEVGGVAYAIAKVANKTSLPKEVDLGLSAYARGSLYLGFAMPPPNAPDKDGNVGLLNEEDPLYVATKSALLSIGTATRDLDSENPKESLARSFPDPQVRDRVVSAIRQLAPTGRKGIDSVSIGGRSVGDQREVVLTPQLRGTISKLIENPVESEETSVFEGTMREIDFDMRRFYLRKLTNVPQSDIRCAYEEKDEKLAESLANKYIRVIGKVERSKDNVPRLIEVHSMEQINLSEIPPLSDGFHNT